MANKPNPDYTKSAVKLCNPAETREQLVKVLELRRQQDEIQEKIMASVPAELRAQMNDVSNQLIEAQQLLKLVIDKYGSYQDCKLGMYAVCQRKEYVSYDIRRVKDLVPRDIVSEVVDEVINKERFEAQITLGKISNETATACKVIENKYAYITK